MDLNSILIFGQNFLRFSELSYVSARQDDWDTYLVYIEFTYNNSVKVSTDFSPFVLQFAQSPRAPWDPFNATETETMCAVMVIR
jgi:hypothetical protein